MRKIIISTVTTLLIVGCGGGDGNDTPKIEGPNYINLPIKKEYKSYAIRDINVKSNNKRTIIIWKEYKEEKGCNNSIDCSYSALYKADKLNGSWILPSKEQDAIKSWDHVNMYFFTGSDVALQSDQKAIIVTTEITTKNSKNYSRVGMFLYKDGSWKPENYIDPYGSLSFMPKVAMDNSGNGLVVWIATDASNSQYHLNLYHASYINDSWSIPQNLNKKSGATNGGGVNYFYPISLTFKNGKGFVTWSQQENSNGSSNYHIYGGEFNINNIPKWTMPSNSNYLENNIGFTEGFVSTSDKQGNKLLAWGNWDQNSKKVNFYTSKKCGAIWHKPSDANDYINSSSQQEQTPSYIGRVSTDMNSNGFAIVAWSQQTNSKKAIYTTRFYTNPCATVTSDNTKVISPNTGEDALFPKVVINNSGKAALAWIQKYNGKERLYLAKYTNDSWQKPNASDYIGANVDSFDIAINDNGIVTIVWSEKEDESHSYLYKKEIDF